MEKGTKKNRRRETNGGLYRGSNITIKRDFGCQPIKPERRWYQVVNKK